MKVWFRRVMSRIVVLAMVLGFVVQAAPAGAVDPATARIDLKVLVITNTTSGTAPSFEAWTSLLDREGVPYDVFDANGNTLTAADLAGTDHAYYQGVVCATRCTDDLGFGSPDLAALEAFLADYDLNLIHAAAFPESIFGLSLGSGRAFDGEVISTTGAGDGVFPYLDGDVTVDIGTFGWDTTVTDPTSFTTLIQGPTGNPIVGIHDNVAGFEEMVVVVSSNAFSLHGIALGHGMVNWLTDGMYLGFARNYFSAHFDDIFLPDDRWDMDDNTTYEDGCATNPCIRMTPADVTRALNYQNATGIRLDMVFNGFGSVDAIETAANDGDPNTNGDPLTDALLAVKDEFYWINHTYTHLNLDTATQQAIEDEITLNIAWAAANGISIDTSELVTGEHSGLGNDPFSIPPNPNLGPALTATGIDWVAADNSHQPDQRAVGSALTVPRHPANVYYNVGTQEEQLDEYNHIYTLPPLGACVNTATTTCNTAFVTWDEYVDSEASIMLRHLITNDPRPHYFHQANLAEDGVFYTVFDEVRARYNDLFDLPLTQPTQKQAGQYIARANAWDAVKDSVTAYRQAGAVFLTAPSSVQAPVTGTPLIGSPYWDSQNSGWTTIGTSTTVLDWTAPVITLSGPNPKVLQVGETYDEPGATATDNVDGDLTGSIVIDSSAVDTSSVGSYVVTYNVTDSSGNAATQVTRTVNVTDSTIPQQTIDSPSDGAEALDPVTISGMASDNSAVVAVNLTIVDQATSDYWNGTGWQDAATSLAATLSAPGATVTGWSYTFDLGGNGLPPSAASYSLSVKSSDDSGNEAFPTEITFDVADVTAPVITLLGDDPVELDLGAAYVEPGATATDDVDGDLTDEIVIDATAVDTMTPGTYVVTYDVSDSSGNAADQLTRTVEVLAPIVPPPVGPTPDGVGAVDPATGIWYLRGSDAVESFYYGNPLDVPFLGDWNCDGVATPGLYRQSDGYVYLRNSNTQGIADITFFFGNPSDVPLVGDFNGDGCDTVSIYRPAEGKVYIINELGSNDGGLGAADFDYYFGNIGDRPFVGDFDGDGIDTIGLHRVSTGLVYMRNSHTAGVADLSFIWGDPNDVVFAGDWDGSGTDTVGLFRPSDSRFYLRLTNTPGTADVDFGFGEGTFLPIVGPF